MIAAAVGPSHRALPGRRDRPGVRRGAAGAIAATGEAPAAVCRPGEILDVTEPEPQLVDRFAARRERFHALYRALKPEFAAAD